MVLDLGAIEIRHLSVMNSFKSFDFSFQSWLKAACVYKNMQVKNNRIIITKVVLCAFYEDCFFLLQISSRQPYNLHT